MFVIPLILGFDKYFLTYLYKGLAVMVISCPCALVISIPLSYFMGIGKAAKNQILVKGASYLEVLTEIDSVLFDKTGTLTKGEFIVTKEYSINKELMYSLLYSAEKNFSHAIAKSITNYLHDKGTLISLVDLINIPGYGVKALYNGEEVLIGNAKLLKENKSNNERLCLRPHLTGASVRKLLKNGAPARFVYPGRVYRNESTDARHERAFFQYEALIVDKNISFSSGMVMIQTILEKVFGRKRQGVESRL